MITLKKLIILAPFTPEMQQKLLDALPTMSENKQLELTDMCWSFIVKQCDMKVQFAQEDAMYQMGLGDKKYTAEDFQKMEDDIYDVLAKKLQEEDEKGSLEDIREKLAQVKKNTIPKKQKAHPASN